MQYIVNKRLELTFNEKLELKRLLLVYTEKTPVAQNMLCHFIDRAIIKTLLKQ